MPSRAQDIAVHRMHTRILIDQFPTVVRLRRPAPLVEDGQGGRTRARNPDGTAIPDATLPAQKFFFSGLNSNGRSQTATRWDITEEGERFLTRFVIVGEWNADIQEDDWFMLGNRRVQILNVFPDRSYQTKCEAVTHDA